MSWKKWGLMPRRICTLTKRIEFIEAGDVESDVDLNREGEGGVDVRRRISIKDSECAEKFDGKRIRM